MVMNPTEWFINERGNQCENCGSPFDKYLNPPTRHHCLIGRSKKHPEYDHEINIELAGWTCCHETGKLDTQEHKEEFAMRQINRGYPVKEWYESLNLRAPEAWLVEL